MNIIRITAATAATGLLVGLAGTSVSAAPSPEDTYIIVSTNTTSVSAMSVESAVESAGGEDVVTYDNVGASVATLTASEAAALDAKPNLVVTKDAEIHATDNDKGPITAADSKAAIHPKSEVRSEAVAESWGLDRIDQRPAALNGTYNRPGTLSGAGVHVWVFDTGLAVNHPEFAGRVGQGYDFVGDGNGVNDCDGHGTHVSGTIASNMFGVAPGAIVHPVRILDCEGSGYWSDFIAGLNKVATVAPPASVANASIGGSYDASVNQAVTNFIAKTNMPFAVAAGNMGDDTRYYSPASTPNAITVAASEVGDHDAYYSNYGSTVDLYAPGTDIDSTYYLDPDYYMTLSGTSMAAPHVTGYLALYTQANPNSSAAEATAAVKAQSTSNAIVDDYYGTPNKLLYTSAVTKVLPPLGVTAKAVSTKRKFYINVNPNRPGSQYYTFTVQKWNSSTKKWVNYKSYKTYGKGETRTIDLRKGTWRAVVAGKYGHRTTASGSVTLKS